MVRQTPNGAGAFDPAASGPCTFDITTEETT